ncbi:hypothetical protein ABID08_003593 [Rhizobium binae]|uniref:Uncharacterized protein n=1 Tax=Rhizobium binae TaxID=1138190 RepID=A0ABV2MIE0_9HYPH
MTHGADSLGETNISQHLISSKVSQSQFCAPVDTAAQRPHSDQQIHYPSFNFQINLEAFSHEQPCSKSSGPNGTETALTVRRAHGGSLSVTSITTPAK